MFLFG